MATGADFLPIAAARGGVSPRAQAGLYLSAFFSLSLTMMLSVTVPLWTVALRTSPWVTGIALGAPGLAPLLLGIHAGTVIDRLNLRGVMAWLAIVATILPLLYPAFPWVSALIVLQLAAGLTYQTIWIGAQSLVGRLAPGDPRYFGRFGAATNFGMFVGPLLAGVAWSVLGARGAFGLMSLWGVGLLFSALGLPAHGEGQQQATHRPLAVLCDLRSYSAAFSLLKHPAVTLVVLATFLRLTSTAMRGSFYPVYLLKVGFSGSTIGFLIATSSLWGAFGALLTERMLALIGSAHRALMGTIVVALISVTVTPLMPGAGSLFTAMAVYGAAMGFNQAVLLSILSSSVGAANQGLGAGIRLSANQVAVFSIPPIMGGIVEFMGFQAGFYITGVVLLGATALVWLATQEPNLAPLGLQSDTQDAQ